MRSTEVVGGRLKITVCGFVLPVCRTASNFFVTKPVSPEVLAYYTTADEIVY